MASIEPRKGSDKCAMDRAREPRGNGARCELAGAHRREVRLELVDAGLRGRERCPGLLRAESRHQMSAVL